MLLTSVDNHGTDEQKYIATWIVSEQTARHKSKRETQRGTLYNPKPSIEQTGELDSLLQYGKSMATFHIKYDLLSPEPRVEETTADLKLVTSISLKQERNDTVEPLYTAMDFLSDGRLAVIDNNNKSPTGSS